MKSEVIDKEVERKLSFIEGIVLEQTGLDKIRTKSRAHEYVLGRFLFCGLAKQYTPYSLATIGSYLDRDHATVLHAIRSLEWELKWNKDLQAQHESLTIIMESQFTETMNAAEIKERINILEKQLTKLKKLYNESFNPKFENEKNFEEIRSAGIQLDTTCIQI